MNDDRRFLDYFLSKTGGVGIAGSGGGVVPGFRLGALPTLAPFGGAISTGLPTLGAAIAGISIDGGAIVVDALSDDGVFIGAKTSGVGEPEPAFAAPGNVKSNVGACTCGIGTSTVGISGELMLGLFSGSIVRPAGGS